MEPKQFTIISVHINERTDPDISKALRPGTYTFNRATEEEGLEDFFGKNISVQAIVGKNGCGKSTLMDIIIMLVNNFTFKMMHDKWVNENTYRICYVQQLYAKLTFRIGEQIGIISCENSRLTFNYGKHKCYWGADIQKPEGYKQMEYCTPDDEVLELTEEFFYTIVINYSIHAFIDSNYRSHLTLHADGDEGNHAWINALFHKNDGYREPITISPFREAGQLDMSRENYLNQQRMASIMVYCDHNAYPFMQEYGLRELSYMYDDHLFLQKFTPEIIGVEDEEERKRLKKSYPEFSDLVIKTFRNSLADENSLAADILGHYDITFDAQKDDRYLVMGYMYLVYKVIDISGTYPTYKDFSDISDLKNVFARLDTLHLNENVWTTNDTKELVEKLDVASHITLKLRQTLNFIRGYKSASKATCDLITESGVFDYETYRNGLNLQIDYTDLQKVMEVLPPPLYYGTTVFEPRGTEPMQGPSIEMKYLSAGQMQYIHILSNIVYHIMNLLSITEEKRVKYRYVNLMLDEIELCFHPEYQRRFLYDLITLLKQLKLNESFGINIIACTHSPFILRGIPLSNILFLEEGVNVTEKMKQKTFGANVNELLAESFFLSGGFMGEFAKNKISDLIDYLQGKDTKGTWDDKKAYNLINQIGEPLIAESLLAIRNVHEQEDEDRILEWHQEQIRLIEERRGNNA